jgi:hypothetical protein
VAFNNAFTAVTGATYTAAQYNTHTRDNLTAIWVYTTQGDLAYATTSTTLARLALVSGGVLYGGASAPAYSAAGSAFQSLRLGSGGVIPEWWTNQMTTVAQRTATQSIANSTLATEAVVDLTGTDIMDDGGWHDPASNSTKIICNVTGLYSSAARVFWDNNSAGARYALIQKNGATAIAYDRRDSAGIGSPVTNDIQSFTDVPFLMNSGDYVELYAGQSSGGALNILSARLSLTLLRRTA